MNTIKKNRLTRLTHAIASASLIIAIGGCGSSGQDVGSALNVEQRFTGVAVDGHLARATVYLDGNNNGTRDPWEAYAFTDNDGYYSYNPLTNTNYCAESTPPSEKIYCLVNRTSLTNVIVRVDGGYDLLTGEPFIGQMSRRVDVPNTNDDIDSVVSPLTTLVTNVESAEDRTEVLNAIGITESDLDVDYMNATAQNDIDSHLLNTALKIHKSVSILSDRLNDNYEELNDEVAVLNDPSPEIYSNLAQEIIASNQNIDEVLTNTDSLVRVMDRSEEVLRDLYEVKELTLPDDLGNEQNPGELSRVVNIVSSVPAVVDRLIDPINLDINTAEAIGGARALETLVIKSVNETAVTDQSIDAAVTFFLDETRDNLVDSLTEALASNTADVSTLASNDFDGEDFDSEDEVSTASQLAEDAQAFTQIAGKSLRVMDLDLGFAPAFLRDLELELYFLGEVDGIDGSFVSCVKYIEDAHVDGTLGEGNTEGELVTGYWSMLGATDNNKESYSLLLTFEFLGSTYQAIMKAAGGTTIQGEDFEQYRFDSDGKYRIWHSPQGLVDISSLPTNNIDCESRLPSRIGR